MLEEARRNYLEGTISKGDYINQIYHTLKVLGDVDHFLSDTGVKSIRLTGNGIICEYRSIPIQVFFEVEDAASPLVHAMCFTSRDRLWEGDYGRKLIESLKTADVFFDIGSNVGYYSLICGKENPEAKICAFEPIHSTYMKLIRNIALNACSNIAPYNFGFFEREATLPMHFRKAGSGSASLRNITGMADLQQEAHFQTLDTFVKESGLVPDVMKIDVEGSELFVLRGGRETLEKGCPVIFIEVLRKWCRAFGHEAAEVFDLLHGLGYRSYVVRGDALEPIANITEQIEDTNFVFKKDQGR